MRGSEGVRQWGQRVFDDGVRGGLMMGSEGVRCGQHLPAEDPRCHTTPLSPLPSGAVMRSLGVTQM
jgi:hypothetical protein